jgi:lipopolysaccharide export system protein LptA
MIKKSSKVVLLSLFLSIGQVASLEQLKSTGSAQAQAPAPAGEGGPIDIRANEQEFAGDHMIARGNVRIIYKDSTIVAPIATLYKDPLTGQPQRAIFTGHPRLVQGANKIDADTIIFEMATSKIVAEGHAHSEVVNEPSEQKTAPTPKIAGQGAKDAEAALAKAARTKDLPEGESPESTDTAADTTTASSQGALAGPGTVTKIITDADKQVYNKSTGQFEADGKVRVRAGDIDVSSDRLRLAYGLDGRPETAVFTGHVNATQGQNNTMSDIMTYFLNTKRLQASGHVRSKVVQNGSGNANKTAQKPTPAPSQPTNGKFEPLAYTAQAAQEAPVTNLFNAPGGATGAPIIILSDAQDFNRDSGRLNASGNVKIFYEDTIGVGPRVVLLRNQDGQPEKVHFLGRSQITQPGKRWIADKITMTVADRKVLAEGNTKAYILPKKDGSSDPGFGNTQLASKRPAQISSKRTSLFQ